MTRITNLSALVLFALAGCGSSTDQPATNGAHGNPGDQTQATGTTNPTDGSGAAADAPTVVSTFPLQGATDALPDDAITIQFSHVMDTASVESTLYCAALAGGYTTDWDDAHMTLTILPDEPMPMAEGVGNDPEEVVGNYFEIVIGAAATSEDGVQMGEGFALGFHTYKRMRTAFSVDPALTGHVDGDNWDVSAPGDWLRVGDVPSNDPTRALVTFDIADLPDTADIVEQAVWTSRMVDTFGNADTIDAYTQAYHVSFDELGEAACNTFPISVVGPFSTWDDTSIVHEVTLAVQDDLDHRATRLERSQYRIQFDGDTNRDDNLDYYAYDAASMELSITYLSR